MIDHHKPPTFGSVSSMISYSVTLKRFNFGASVVSSILESTCFSASFHQSLETSKKETASIKTLEPSRSTFKHLNFSQEYYLPLRFLATFQVFQVCCFLKVSLDLYSYLPNRRNIGKTTGAAQPRGIFNQVVYSSVASDGYEGHFRACRPIKAGEVLGVSYMNLGRLWKTAPQKKHGA